MPKPHAAAIALLLTSCALAQCDQWLPVPGSSELRNATRLCVIDHDGPGPQPPRLYAAATLTLPSGGSALEWWDGLAWNPVPTWNNFVRSLFALHQPAAGLPPGTLLIGGPVSSSPPGATRFFGAWDGQTLTPIGPTDTASYSTGAVIYAITTWDPDGPGPQPPLIIAAGAFTRIGGVNASNVAAWNGTQWLALGDGLPTAVNALISFDPDGDGPATPLLLAGSAAWDGVSWQTLGNGFNGPVNALAILDPDGDGPLPPALYAGGSFTSSGLETTGAVAKWTGSSWIPAGAATPGTTVNDLASLDLDGPGPQPPRLFATGSSHLMILSNGVWTGTPAGYPGFEPGRALALFDPDGDLPRSPEVIVAAADTGYPSGPFAWDGQRWSILGDEINGMINDFAWYDEDGEGPNPPALYAVGSFGYAGGHAADGLARWDGQRWVGLGTATGRRFIKIVSYDPDGSGPQTPWLVALDGPQYLGPTPVLRWNGSAWERMGNLGMSGAPTGLCAIDDGGSASLFVGGQGVQDDGHPYGSVARSRDGVHFETIGGINDGMGCAALFAHDPDGAGPLPPAIYDLSPSSTGTFRRWDGTSWTIVAGLLTGPNNFGVPPIATSWDPDGSGPALPELVLGAVSARAVNGPVLAGPCSFSGSGWRQLGTGAPAVPIHSLYAFDPDADGPLPGQLFAGFEWTPAGLAPILRRLSGDAWVTVGSGFWAPNLPLQINAMITVDQGDGPELWIGGRFTYADGHPAANFARYRLAGPIPLITQQPQSAAPCSNEPASLTVTAPGAGLTYRWRIFDTTANTTWRDVADGPVIIAGRQVGLAAGSSSPTLTFRPAPYVSASFTCVVTGPCGAAISNPAAITAAACCGSPDFNHDGDVATDADIAAFFACLAGNCCPTCDSADFNADGDVATDADIEAFFRVLAGGNC